MKKKLNHRQKQRLARRHMTKMEIIDRVPVFQTEWWESRKLGIYNSIRNNGRHKNEKISKTA